MSRMNRLIAKVGDISIKPEARLLAARALCEIEDSGVFEPLIDFIVDPKYSWHDESWELGWEEREEAANELCELLSRIPIYKMDDLINIMCKGKSYSHRTVAAKILAMTGNPRVIEFLLKALSNASGSEERDHIAKNLASFGDAIISPILEALRAKRITIKTAEVISYIDTPKALNSLLEILQNVGFWELHRSVIHALGNIKGKDATQALLSVVNSPPAERFLVTEYPSSDTPYIERVTIDLRRDAINALGYINEHEATQVLLEVLRDGTMRDVCSDVIRALSNIKGQDMEQIFVEVLRDESMQEFHDNIVSTLGTIGNPSTAQVLFDRLLKSDHEITGLILQALDSIQKGSTTTIAVSIGGKQISVSEIIEKALHPMIPLTIEECPNQNCVYTYYDRGSRDYPPAPGMGCSLKKIWRDYGEERFLCRACIDCRYELPDRPWKKCPIMGLSLAKLI